jgi:hypothetical protein
VSFPQVQVSGIIGTGCIALGGASMNLLTQETCPDPNSLTSHYTPVELSYLAGYFDGEGTITCASKGYLSLRMIVSSSDFYSLHLFEDVFGGVVYELIPLHISKKSTPGLRMFRWALYGTNCIEPLRALIPYLRSKADEARAVVESKIIWRVKHDGAKLSAIEKQGRDDLRNTLISLKNTGRQKSYPLDVPLTHTK